MKQIRPEAMSKEVRLLWETAELHDLKPQQITPFLNVSYRTIYGWFNGKKPLRAHVELILKAVKTMDAALTVSALESGEAVWGQTAEEDPAIIADAKIRAAIRPVFYQLQARCSDGEKRLVSDNWAGFIEIFCLLKKHGIGIPRRKARS